MRIDIILLAQATEILDVADKSVGILERIQAGGILLLSLVVAVVCAVAFWWQLKANKLLNEIALSEAKNRESSVKSENTGRLKEQETLLREMMERDKEAQEAQTAATTAVEKFASLIEGQSGQSILCKTNIDRIETMVKLIGDRLDRIERQTSK